MIESFIPLARAVAYIPPGQLGSAEVLRLVDGKPEPKAYPETALAYNAGILPISPGDVFALALVGDWSATDLMPYRDGIAVRAPWVIVKLG